MFLTSMELFNLWKGCKGVCVREVCTRSVHVAQPERWRRNKCVRREGDKLVGRYPFRSLGPNRHGEAESWSREMGFMLSALVIERHGERE